MPIGNTNLYTKGCPLMGHYWMKVGQDYQVYQSAYAYQYAYPLIVQLLKLQSKCVVEVSHAFLN
jgi:hypothetical protein